MHRDRIFILNAPESADPIYGINDKEFADEILKKIRNAEDIVLPYGWDLQCFALGEWTKEGGE